MNSRQTAILLGFLLAFALVWEQIESIRLGYRLEQMHAQVRDQEDKNAYLRLELERLHSPQWLAQAAHDKLSMSPPSPESLIVLGVPSLKQTSAGSSGLLSGLFFGPRDFR